jgi:3-methyladenine DNA glycosylase AlkD
MTVTIEQAMARLEAAGSAKRRSINVRHGAGENQFGVSFADLRALAKEIGRDQTLAGELWSTGNNDARILACLVADPTRMTDADLDRWLAEIDYYVLCDTFAAVASGVPGVRERMERWTPSSRDWTGQAGYDLLGYLAMKDSTLPDGFFVDRLGTIEREIHSRGNRTRHAMNAALIAIGIRSEPLRVAATEAARRIGPVVVDHGRTGCVTPEAIAYIERTTARARARTTQAG